MYKRVKIKKLGKKKSHRKLLIRNLLKSLFENGYVETTSPKAKVLKAEAESAMVRFESMPNGVQKNDKMKLIFGKEVALDRFKESLTKDVTVSIVKTRFRDGDKAEMSKVSLIGLDKATVKSAPKKTTKKSESKGDKKEVEHEEQVGLTGKNKKGGIADTVKKAFSNNAAGKTERARSRSGL